MEITLKQTTGTSVQTTIEDFTINVDRPVSKGGGGSGLMGGQYLLIGIGGCFCSTLFAAAKSRGITFKGLTARVEAKLSDDLPKRFTAVSVDVSYSHCNHPDAVEKLLKIAEKGCISLNTVKRGLRITTHALAV